ncbi:hypothetical protein ACQPZF_18155 [Actinosynnema sp. CS-041913]|uniref:hypothetical protein n=1 Tax=Actinosynnema sp. CS-041913 TaxID=3239917 RepID=UPI003D8D8681
MSNPDPQFRQHIETRDFRGWRGLPEDADYAEFQARFPRLVDADARGLLGSANEPAYFSVHIGDGYPQHLTAWRRDTRLLMVETELPRMVTPLDDLTAELGEPAARLDYFWGILTVPEGAHIYPGNGITLFIGPERQVLKFALFTPCDLEEYLRTRHHDPRMVPLPLPLPDDFRDDGM